MFGIFGIIGIFSIFGIFRTIRRVLIPSFLIPVFFNTPKANQGPLVPPAALLPERAPSQAQVSCALPRLALFIGFDSFRSGPTAPSRTSYSPSHAFAARFACTLSHLLVRPTSLISLSAVGQQSFLISVHPPSSGSVRSVLLPVAPLGFEQAVRDLDAGYLLHFQSSHLEESFFSFPADPSDPLEGAIEDFPYRYSRRKSAFIRKHPKPEPSE